MTFRHSPKNQRALTLIECLVYMTVMFIILGLAFTAFYQCQTNAIALQRNAAEIARTIRAGEQWRNDVRQSPGLSYLDQDGIKFIQLPATNGEVAYVFSGSNIWRKLAGKDQWVVFLENVKASEMKMEKRNDLTVCSWDLELKEHHQKSRVKPMFSFLAVPQQKESQ
jgi:hypothetical protein